MYSELPVFKQHKLYLQDFWLEVGGRAFRKKRSVLSQSETIKLLIKLGNIRLNYRSKTHTRKSFDKKKIKLKKFNGFDCCFACGGLAQARHHIIWLSHGGRNQTNNVLALCNNCHAEIHPWLK